MRRPRLDARLDPYLRGLEPATTRLLAGVEAPLTPLPALERLLGPRHPRRRPPGRAVPGGSAAVARRLREAGAPGDVARFRAEQVLWGLAGFVVAVLVTFGLPALAGRSVSAGPAGWWAARSSACSAGSSAATGGSAGRPFGARD